MKQILTLLGFGIFTSICYYAGKSIEDTTIFGLCLIIGVLAITSKFKKEIKKRGKQNE